MYQPVYEWFEVKKINFFRRPSNHYQRSYRGYFDISIGSCHIFFSNFLGRRRVSAKFLPKRLNFDPKNRRIFWPKTTSQSCLIHHIHMIWHHVTFLDPKTEETYERTDIWRD
uniref:Putative LOC101239764 [Hydra vulgaris] n=1 Tax=Lepeophtheirus salmonis TaxID=72036 RepID=A0A0K2UDC9_LEPSM